MTLHNCTGDFFPFKTVFSLPLCCRFPFLTMTVAARCSAPFYPKPSEFVYHCYDFASTKCIAFALFFAAYVKEFYFSQLSILRHTIILIFLSLSRSLRVHRLFCFLLTLCPFISASAYGFIYSECFSIIC